MVRGGRGYGGSSGGRGRGSSYRGPSGSNFRPGGSSRSSHYNSSTGAGGGGSGGGGGGSSSYHSSGSRTNYGSSSNYQYDSRSRDRFSSSRHSDGRHDDHKRSHRASSSRDRSSPDRKRSRHEDSRMSSSYSSSSYRRNESQSSSRNRPTPPVASISGRGTGSSSGGHYRSGQRNEDSSSSHRHSGNDSMGPPKSAPPRSRLTRSRGGGLSSGRFRGSTSSRGSIRIIRRRESSDVKLMRRKLLLARQRDRVRRIKIARLTSSLRKRRETALPRKSSSSTVRKSRSDKKDDDSKNEDSDEKKKKDSTSVAEGDDDDDVENGENEKHSDDIEVKKEFPIKKENKKKKSASEERQSDEEKEDAGKMITVKTEEADDGEQEDKEKDDSVSKTKSPSSRKMKSSYIKLICIHCRMKCLTFKEYNNHLYSRIHRTAMKRLALKQKAQLSRMRMNQRNAQRDIEENSKDELEDCPPQFCPLCRLNYRQPKAKHQLSESHRKMKKFLMPYCNTCHIAFKSPMMYEAHRCSLDHIRRKADGNESRSEASGDEKEVDLNNFLTVDSIGEIDGHSGDEVPEDITEEDGKEKVNVGAEYVKKTEALYCDLCRLYFSIRDDEESTIKKHCATRSHLKAYLRHKEDQNLREEAERVQRSSRNKDSTKEKKKDNGANEKSPVKVKLEHNEENEEEGDKLWDGVDKDLGDLLREVEPDGQEDDEEDGSVLNLNTERFDRFRNSEKKGVNGTAGEIEDENEQDDDEKEATLEDSNTSINLIKEDDIKNDEEAIEAN